ncbi:MAG TPA: hypothetical protein QGF70_04570 [Candidatus Thalassarchaeaceae archaeon]|jgi:hypothetical protein|nr:hypothetical protein [Candidatus Thalassarchaeaceae archaeon]MDP7658805.1 hypothetical protein [Candidatus Thalassarchaeaceae archaeon]HJL64842.1 hypothetical protein [Candidatus Thalassarchaeaceae archaeon]HJO42469.1 hypothetical protein [Candidatus Thalassarchaeaceae archaeon]|tara:strand:+ start:2609 stop:2989 length:381 start_codon:yes stop_codon:yes gene_type:complete
MSNFERVKQLLDGDIELDELEIDTELYQMAESIYGREALDEMGVMAPERPPESIVQPNGDSNHKVQIPLPEIPLPEDSADSKPKKRWGLRILLLMILVAGGLAGAHFADLIDLSEYIDDVRETLGI